MDFDFRYTPQQEEFRKEVREWLDVNMPMDFEISYNPHDALPGSAKYEFIRTARRKLGEKGWLAPTWPKEYGGGGLGVDEAVVIQEELAERPWTRFGIGDFFTGTLNVFAPQLYALGTEEQKGRFLPPILKGEVIGYQGYSESGCGSDVAAVKTTAIRDGDDYVVNGEKLWLGSQYDNAEYIFLVAVTDPKARRHRNVGLFWVPVGLPGMSKVRVPMMRNCHTGGWQIFFDSVRVPGEYLIGGHENASNAWRVISGTLSAALRTNIRGAPIRDRNHEYVLDYVRGTEHDGQPLVQDPQVRDALTEVEIQLEINRLLNLRQIWKANTGKRTSGYDIHQFTLSGKVTTTKQSKVYNDILGPATLMKAPEWTLLDGSIEYQQHIPVAHHAAGTTQEVNRMLMARWVCQAGD